MEDDDIETEEGDDIEKEKVEEDDDKDDNMAEGEVEDYDVAEDEVEDDDVKGEEDSILMLRRRKRMMLRRKTDPKTGTYTLCQLARSKCMPTCHKRHQNSHLIRKFTGKMPRPRLSPERGYTFCASLCNGKTS